jgi:predicted DNA-binding antitoxin AbrB/MazE fold protein
MKTVIFYVDKVTDEFKFSQISENKTEEEILSAVERHNSQEDKKDRVYIVTDKHVINAIIKKDTYDTIRSCAKEVKKEIAEMQQSVEDSLRCVERSVESMMEFIKDREN